jgi:hypothetical protein
MKTAKEMHSLATSKKSDKFKKLLEAIEGQAGIGNYRMTSTGLLDEKEIDVLVKAGYRVEDCAGSHMVYWDTIKS